MRKKKITEFTFHGAKVINENANTSPRLTTSGELISTLVQCNKKCLILKAGEILSFPLLQVTCGRVIFMYLLGRAISHLFLFSE